MSFSSLVPFTLPFLILLPLFFIQVQYMIIEAEILNNQLVIELELIVEEPHKQSFLFQFTNRVRTFFFSLPFPPYKVVLFFHPYFIGFVFI